MATVYPLPDMIASIADHPKYFTPGISDEEIAALAPLVEVGMLSLDPTYEREEGGVTNLYTLIAPLAEVLDFLRPPLIGFGHTLASVITALTADIASVEPELPGGNLLDPEELRDLFTQWQTDHPDAIVDVYFPEDYALSVTVRRDHARLLRTDLSRAGGEQMETENARTRKGIAYRTISCMWD